MNLLRRPRRMLDLYCCAGGAARGYQRAGWEVHGVDNRPQPNYAGDRFILGDAIEYLLAHGHEYDGVHASPPCQADCALTAGTNQRLAGNYTSWLAATRAGLVIVGKPYVIEQPVGRAKMRRDVMLCGLHFGLKVFLHRQFELGGWSTPNLPHRQKELHAGHRVAGWRHGVRYDGDMFAVYGDGGGKGSVAEWQAAKGIDWTDDKRELAEAIPPAYTHHLGTALAAHLDALEEVA